MWCNLWCTYPKMWSSFDHLKTFHATFSQVWCRHRSLLDSRSGRNVHQTVVASEEICCSNVFFCAMALELSWRLLASWQMHACMCSSPAFLEWILFLEVWIFTSLTIWFSCHSIIKRDIFSSYSFIINTNYKINNHNIVLLFLLLKVIISK